MTIGARSVSGCANLDAMATGSRAGKNLVVGIISVVGFLALSSCSGEPEGQEPHRGTGSIYDIEPGGPAWDYLPTFPPDPTATPYPTPTPYRLRTFEPYSPVRPCVTAPRVVPPQVNPPKVIPPRVEAPRVIPPRVDPPRVVPPRVTTTCTP